MYLIRLDDASEYMDVEAWNKMEILLDKYNIKPIVGIIPNNQDDTLVSRYNKDLEFWNKAKTWRRKDWAIALHGYTHVCLSNSGGINPVNLRSEFAGVALEEQRKKIASGIRILQAHDLNAKIFFAPSHTFNLNTLEALRLESDIKIISDTIANNIYKERGFYFIPQQSGNARRLPFKVTTFCYHPNVMSEEDFKILEDFIQQNRNNIGGFQELNFQDRELNLYDYILRKMYFSIRTIRNRLKG
jgi:predicted deacetylase